MIIYHNTMTDWKIRLMAGCWLISFGCFDLSQVGIVDIQWLCLTSDSGGRETLRTVKCLTSMATSVNWVSWHVHTLYIKSNCGHRVWGPLSSIHEPIDSVCAMTWMVVIWWHWCLRWHTWCAVYPLSCDNDKAIQERVWRRCLPFWTRARILHLLSFCKRS